MSPLAADHDFHLSRRASAIPALKGHAWFRQSNMASECPPNIEVDGSGTSWLDTARIGIGLHEQAGEVRRYKGPVVMEERAGQLV